MEKNYLTNLATSIPIFSASLYLLGLSYHEGYLEIYGLDSSQFSLASDRALFTGFLSFSTIGIKSWPYAIFICVAILFSTIVFSSIKDFSIIKYVKNSLTKKNTSIEDLTKIQKILVLLSHIFNGLFFTIILFLIIALTSLAAGKKHAQSELLAFSKKESNIVKIKYKLENNALQVFEKATLITCNSDSCAYWDGNETHILQLDRIESISIIPKEYLGNVAKKVTNLK